MARKLTLDFLKTEAASGSALAMAAIAAVLVANSPWSADYFTWLKSYHVLQIVRSGWRNRSPTGSRKA